MTEEQEANLALRAMCLFGATLAFLGLLISAFAGTVIWLIVNSAH